MSFDEAGGTVTILPGEWTLTRTLEIPADTIALWGGGGAVTTLNLQAGVRPGFLSRRLCWVRPKPRFLGRGAEGNRGLAVARRLPSPPRYSGLRRQLGAPVRKASSYRGGHVWENDTGANRTAKSRARRATSALHSAAAQGRMGWSATAESGEAMPVG